MQETVEHNDVFFWSTAWNTMADYFDSEGVTAFGSEALSLSYAHYGYIWQGKASLHVHTNCMHYMHTQCLHKFCAYTHTHTHTHTYKHACTYTQHPHSDQDNDTHTQMQMLACARTHAHTHIHTNMRAPTLSTHTQTKTMTHTQMQIHARTHTHTCFIYGDHCNGFKMRFWSTQCSQTLPSTKNIHWTTSSYVKFWLGLSQLFLFSPCYSIQNFSNNSPIILKDVPHYSQIFPFKFRYDSMIVL